MAQTGCDLSQYESFVKLLRLQKHEFLNHLQVISGLLQLNKPERALVYVRKITGLIQQSAKILEINLPELVIFLLEKQGEAEKVQIESSMVATTNLQHLGVPVNQLVKLIALIWDMVTDNIKFAPGMAKELSLFINEEEAGYAFCFLVPGPMPPAENFWENVCRPAAALVRDYGAVLYCTNAGKDHYITLCIPKKTLE